MRSNAVISSLGAGGLLMLAMISAAYGAPPPPPGRLRIVSLAPSVTETLFALGAGSEVVGVSQYDDYPPAVEKLPRVGSFLTPNVEAIAALRPNLIVGLATSANQREIRALSAMGYDTLLIDDDSVAQIEQTVGLIGARIGRSAEAGALLAGINARLDAVRARVEHLPKRRVLMVVGHQPMVAVGRGTFLDELLKMARADNIADKAAGAWPRLSVEYVIGMRPEVILDPQVGSGPATQRGFWSRYSAIPAVREHEVHGYPKDPTLHPGPRIAETLELLASLIHPTVRETAPAPGRSAQVQGAR